MDIREWVDFFVDHYNRSDVWCDNISCEYYLVFMAGDKVIAKIGYNGYKELEDSVAIELGLSRGDYTTLV
jgi:hypothetical protein